MKRLLFLSAFASTTVLNAICQNPGCTRCHKNNAVYSTVASYLSCAASLFRESNQAKIEAAKASMKKIKDIADVIMPSLHNEEQLLKNIESLGLKKEKAIEILSIFDSNFATLHDIVDCYNSSVTPWNWSTEMEDIAKEAFRFINNYEIFKLYFESHFGALYGWESLEKYEDLAGIDLKNKKQVLEYARKMHGFGIYEISSAVEGFEIRLNTINYYLLLLDFAEKFPKLEPKLKELSSQLNFYLSALKNSEEFYVQRFMSQIVTPILYPAKSLLPELKKDFRIKISDEAMDKINNNIGKNSKYDIFIEN